MRKGIIRLTLIRSRPPRSGPVGRGPVQGRRALLWPRYDKRPRGGGLPRLPRPGPTLRRPGRGARRTVKAGGQKHALALVRERIRTRKPAAYVLRESWFAGLEFYVDERVLVPDRGSPAIESRFSPSFEIPAASSTSEPAAAASRSPAPLPFREAEVHATDISAGALEIASRNAERHGVRDRVRLLRSDVYESLAASATTSSSATLPMSRPLIWRPSRPSTATSRRSVSTAATTASQS